MDDDDDYYDGPKPNKDPTLSDPQLSSSSSSSTHPHQSLPTPTPATTKNPEQDVVEFDSQDEDECEDLFAGVWSPALALKRRQAKSFGGARAKLKGIAAGAAALRGL